jgi:integrase
MGARRLKQTRSRWEDFLSFLSDAHPAVELVVHVTRAHANEYITHVRTAGRWDPTVAFKRGKRKQKVVTYTPNNGKPVQLSRNTQNDFLRTCKMVFKHLQEPLGMYENPFEKIKPLKIRGHQAKRGAFTKEQLARIGEKATGPIYSLMLTGMCTGLTKGDACLLTRDAVVLDPLPGWITWQRRKTGTPLRIPLVIPGLRPHLAERLAGEPPAGEYAKYVFPALAEMYLTNRHGIVYRVNKLLDDCEITHRQKPRGRTRAVSSLGTHALRHTFAYLAGLHNVPLDVVQEVLGHMTPDMTRAYMAHANDEDKLRELAKMPNYLMPEKPTAPEEEEPGGGSDASAKLMEVLGKNWAEKVLKLVEKHPDAFEDANA